MSNYCFKDNRIFSPVDNVYLDFKGVFQYSELNGSNIINVYVYRNPRTRQNVEFTDKQLQELERISLQVINLNDEN